MYIGRNKKKNVSFSYPRLERQGITEKLRLKSRPHFSPTHASLKRTPRLESRGICDD
jgi:hypothetical protein